MHYAHALKGIAATLVYFMPPALSLSLLKCRNKNLKVTLHKNIRKGISCFFIAYFSITPDIEKLFPSDIFLDSVPYNSKLLPLTTATQKLTLIASYKIKNFLVTITNCLFQLDYKKRN